MSTDAVSSANSTQNARYQAMLKLAELQEEERELEEFSSSNMGSSSGLSQFGEESPYSSYDTYGSHQSSATNGLNLDSPQQVFLAIQMGKLQEQQNIDNIRLGGMQSRQNSLNQLFNSVIQGDSGQAKLDGASDAAGI